MRLIAITGSIGCGKTTIAGLVRSLGYAVFDVDAWVRRLYYKKSFIEVIRQNFPEVVENMVVNKRKLRNIVFNDNAKLKKLEGLIHPFLKQTLLKTIQKNAKSDYLLFVDVALLFEMGWEKYCDSVILATVDYDIQKKRVMARDNVSGEDFDKINNVQLASESKILLSDIVIDTDLPKNKLLVKLMRIIEELKLS